ncbi:MAG: hypothetical protein KDJ47_02565 [Hyphomicrobiaceae bacterium]|nr:hypothetical protein [Hyphomicrobiaceae bacterium]
MQRTLHASISRFEKVIADAVADLVQEIRDHDVANLIAFVRMERLKTLECLIDADCELLFKPRTMQFGQRAEVRADWQTPPSIELAMEFHFGGVDVFYRLSLGSDVEGPVKIDYMRFEKDGHCTTAEEACLDRALQAARRP